MYDVIYLARQSLRVNTVCISSKYENRRGDIKVDIKGQNMFHIESNKK